MTRSASQREASSVPRQVSPLANHATCLRMVLKTVILNAYCFLKNSAAFSGSMVEISILVPTSNPAQIEVLGKIVQCQ